MKQGDTLDAPNLGMRIVFRRTAAETGGEVLEYDVIGRPRGFVTQGHVHPGQEERHEVIAGADGLVLGKSKRVYGAGETFAIPAGAPHRHFPAGSGEGHVRVELRPALRTELFLEQLAGLDRDGQVTKRGLLRPVAAARMIAEFEQEGRASRPPAAVQKAFARARAEGRVARRGRGGRVRLRRRVGRPCAEGGRLRGARRRPHVPGVVEAGLHRGRGRRPAARRRRLQPALQGQAAVPPAHDLGDREIDPPNRVVAEVGGDLRGRGIWTLTEAGEGVTHVRFDWTVFADRKLLRTLTPVLRPVFRANHNWAIARAMEGLEPYAQRGDR